MALYLKKGFKSMLAIDGEVERQIAREGKSYLFPVFRVTAEDRIANVHKFI